jgi:cysteine desulfurase
MTVYMDYNAAAPLSEAARAAMTTGMDAIGNPSSVHSHGRVTRRLIEDARLAVAATTGAQPSDVVFTGSGTEACQLMLRLPGRSRQIVAATEHAAVLAAAPAAEPLPVNADGYIEPDSLRHQLGSSAADAVVAVMLANNETGVVQPISELADIAHAAGALLVVDAAQAYGKLPLNLTALGADAFALSSAKIGGPLGVGAAVFACGHVPEAFMTGGGQEKGLRGGSENVIGIAGFGAAAAEVPTSINLQPAIADLRDQMEASIRAFANDATPIAANVERLANTSSLAMPGIPAATQVMALDLAGFAVSAGAACSSGKVQRSHVLDAMGLDDALVTSTIRVSLGLGTTTADIEGFVQAWRTLYSRRNPSLFEQARA